MRGAMPIRSMSYYRIVGKLKYEFHVWQWMIPSVPLQRGLISKMHWKFRALFRGCAVDLCRWSCFRQKTDEVLDSGFDATCRWREFLLNEPGFVNRMKQEEQARCNCGHSNYCIGRMYTIEMACHQHLKEQSTFLLQRRLIN